jgi:hypothetical protein
MVRFFGFTLSSLISSIPDRKKQHKFFWPNHGLLLRKQSGVLYFPLFIGSPPPLERHPAHTRCTPSSTNPSLYQIHLPTTLESDTFTATT